MVGKLAVELVTDAAAKTPVSAADRASEYKRLFMNFRCTDERALHHCVSEVLDNSVDEYLAGHCTKIDVTVHLDGSIRSLKSRSAAESAHCQPVCQTFVRGAGAVSARGPLGTFP